MKQAVKFFVRGGLREEVFRREFDRPSDMRFKSANEENIRQHSPIRFLASANFMQCGKEFSEKFLDAFFNLWAGNVVWIIQINAEIKFLHPPFHQRDIPFFRVKQNELVDVPSEEKFRAGAGRLVE